MNQSEAAFDQILVKMRTSLHLVEEMEAILAQISRRAHRGLRRERPARERPAFAGLEQHG
jgi:hypothetical protein